MIRRALAVLVAAVLLSAVPASRASAEDAVANPDQADADGDGKGAACDTQELPLTRDDCLDDGWKRFDGSATFRNLGECVRFVATGGKER